jgi:hypothetical protein
MAAQNIVHGLGRASIRNVLGIDPGEPRQLDHCDMVLGADAGGTVAQLVLFAALYHIGEAFDA